MYCSNCSAKLSDGDKFCSTCGAQVNQNSAITSTSNEAISNASQAAPVKKMALWKKIALGFVAFVVVVFGLAMFLTSDLIDPVERQIAALKVGDIDSAYSQTSIAFQDATSKEQFTAFVKANPILLNTAKYSFSERSFENNLGTLKGTLTSKDGGVIPIEYRLVKENDEWKILAFKFTGTNP